MSAMMLHGPCAELAAKVRVPASKSLTNRALVAAAVAGGGVIANPLDCEDTRLLARALEAAGWPVRWWADGIEVGAREAPSGERRLWLGGSGTGARLLLSLLATTPGRFVLDGNDRLRSRPMAPLVTTLRALGARLDDRDGFLPATIRGRRLAGGEVTVRPEVSSQFVSSLLLAAPLMAEGLQLEVAGELPSAPYVTLTEEVLAAFGAVIEHVAGSRRWVVAPARVRPSRLTMEGDWSAAAFFAAAAAVAGGQVEIAPLAHDSRQGDRALCRVLADAGVRVERGDGTVCFSGRGRRPFAADLRDIPDLFPALSVVAATVGPGCELTGIEHLRHKESDRLAVMIANLARLGAELVHEEGTVRVRSPLTAGGPGPVPVAAASDHRVAMAMAVAALVRGPVELDDPACVAKSFPAFWEVWQDMLRQSHGGGR